MKASCEGVHSYFIAETAAVISEGTLSVVAVCTRCGEAKFHKFKVSDPAGQVELGSENKK